ncbi:unnamed protein product [Cercopithifilaria johnstoni]|uniref:Uncharacterized protein n=1 Tax=Cercopithifilaria johnstoni TaxID=2874296 RepID=A0A8J2Q164_9BILA|nr:unnamed protein product [Cercopithifilaria johnstoni]
MAACACIGCCACYIFKTEIRSTLKFAKRQTRSTDQTQGTNDIPGRELTPSIPSPQISPKTDTQEKAHESWF